MLMISTSDLESWSEDPESFCLEEDADHWEYSVRSCVEKVVSVLFTQYKSVLAPVATQLLSGLNPAPASSMALQSVLVRDAL